MRTVSAIAALALSTLPQFPVQAQPAAADGAYPAKPVRIIVPYPISGPTDIRGASRLTRTYKLVAQNAPPAVSDLLARIVQRAVQTGTAQTVALERQPGGLTSRGAASAARAAADPHTLLLSSNATIVINPHYFHDIGYEPLRELDLVTPLAIMPFVLMVANTLPVDGLPRLVSWLKVRPGEVNYASSGEGSTGHYAGELFRRMAALDVVHVSYNGGLAALNGVATGQARYMFAAMPLALPYVASEHVRGIGIASARRFALLPNLPTLAESGLPGFEVEGWYALHAPAGAPRAALVWVAERVSAELDTDPVRNQLVMTGLEPVAGARSQFATRIHTETEKWAPLLRATRAPQRPAK